MKINCAFEFSLFDIKWFATVQITSEGMNCYLRPVELLFIPDNKEANSEG
ncbi:MAG: hypothetical protein DDT26_00125 [Dehalococcoidia bacterium]|nr:hypothetical protein [Chloroflexota bacterium]